MHAIEQRLVKIQCATADAQPVYVEIAQVLPAKDYPADTHGFVMELMEKFEVAFGPRRRRASRRNRSAG